ncbi:hypothetical protein K491DRAFT_293732 [Lophiostoma macrostomum CBS 122681]|uniref:Uncharacterized protein n=1 Tax=Lophiostoma macrostomum CBS 122681 TaxID=1314788 RepID=A0A6A6TFL8_9PLEO|nr:hypothetical protein K491DRAFT_293732 [Lophiostoma macrostomum CBS 122681]
MARAIVLRALCCVLSMLAVGFCFFCFCCCFFGDAGGAGRQASSLCCWSCSTPDAGRRKTWMQQPKRPRRNVAPGFRSIQTIFSRSLLGDIETPCGPHQDHQATLVELPCSLCRASSALLSLVPLPVCLLQVSGSPDAVFIH